MIIKWLLLAASCVAAVKAIRFIDLAGLHFQNLGLQQLPKACRWLTIVHVLPGGRHEDHGDAHELANCSKFVYDFFLGGVAGYGTGLVREYYDQEVVFV